MKRKHDQQHLDAAHLIAFLDATLPWIRRVDVEVHLAACSACRSRLDILGGISSRPPASIQVTEELPEILAAIRRQAARQSRRSDSQEAKARAAEQISPYLGTVATARLLEDVSPDCRNLLSSLEPVLSLFLGQRAGGRLSTRVVETAVVRF